MQRSDSDSSISDRASIESRVAREKNPIKRFLLVLGPGLITGAADDDPSGIGTYTATGASFGFATLWTAPLTLPMMAAVQFICAKIDMVSGMGLARVLRKYYPRPNKYIVSLVAILVFYFVILASAATLYATGETKVQTATDAAQALGPLSSRAASILFSVGLIGSGFLAVPVLTPPFLSLPMSHPL